jgi:hypothetical protein
MMRVRPALALAACLLASSGVRAQEAVGELDAARGLARTSATLLQQGKYAEAFERAKEAEAIRHAPFHLAVMGAALEGMGRLAEAMATYERLVAEPLPPNASSVARTAQEDAAARLRGLEARVPSVMIVVPAGVEATATLDGQPIEWRTRAARRLDAGRHVVRVTAPGYRTFEQALDLPQRGGVVVVEAAMLPEGASAATGDPATADAPAERRSRVPEAIAFGAGGVGLVVGAVAGAMFLGRLGDLQDRCPDDRCTEAERGDIDTAYTLSTVSTIGFAVAAAGAVTGITLLVLRPSAPERPSAAVWMSPRGAGLTARF